MSSQVPNPTTRAQISVAFRASPSVHPDYSYWAHTWEKIRDAEIGEIEVKNKRQAYLPKMSGHDAEQYQAYLTRAVFFNMTAKTLGALYGTVFRRYPKVSGMPAALLKSSEKISKDGMSLNLLSKTVVKEVLAVGRYGMLVDADPDGAGEPYIACYTAENIIDWHMSDVRGRMELTRVVLREIIYDREGGAGSLYSYKARYRVLELEALENGGFIYSQAIFEQSGARDVPALDNDDPDFRLTPTVRGEPLDYIPFVIIGPFTNHPDVQKPPILDIVTLNFSHYHSYAQLEQGRFFTANPVYWAQNSSGSSKGDYWVGPDVVWELGKDESAGIIEFQGQGLKFLESALTNKEQQIAAIGGRMMPGTSKSAAESDNSLKMKEANEQTLLLNVADTTDEGMTIIIRWWADWSNVSPDKVIKIFYELNRDFLLKDIGAREFRAIHQMYADGIIPITVVYEYLKKAEVIPEWMSQEEYTALVKNADEFPHMVDVLAQMQNFPDAKSFNEFRIQKLALASGPTVAPKTGEPAIPGVQRQVTDARALSEQQASEQ